MIVLLVELRYKYAWSSAQTWNVHSPEYIGLKNPSYRSWEMVVVV